MFPLCPYFECVTFKTVKKWKADAKTRKREHLNTGTPEHRNSPEHHNTRTPRNTPEHRNTLEHRNTQEYQSKAK